MLWGPLISIYPTASQNDSSSINIPNNLKHPPIVSRSIWLITIYPSWSSLKISSLEEGGLHVLYLSTWWASVITLPSITLLPYSASTLANGII